MIRTLILYESKYGFTEMIAKQLALILGPARYYRASEMKGDYKKYEVIVLCSPIYQERIDERILEFAVQNKEWLQNKKIILIGTCLAVNRINEYLNVLNDIFGDSVVFQAAIGGRMILNGLSSKDYDLIAQFSKMTGAVLKDIDLYDEHQFIEIALEMKRIKDEGIKTMAQIMVKKYIDEFINRHNTCVLATGHEQSVRATPLEYVFYKECFYILSEGGEKFANLLVNKNISMGIYDAYTKMSELAGMQIKGNAEMVSIGSDEYLSVLTKRGLEYNKVAAFPVALNLIKIHAEKIELLWSKFNELGYDTKQIYYNKA